MPLVVIEVARVQLHFDNPGMPPDRRFDAATLRSKDQHGVRVRRSLVARMEPPGPAFGGPDDKLRVIRDRLTPDYAALHPGYKAGTEFAATHDEAD
jgi:hypothetical protein